MTDSQSNAQSKILIVGDIMLDHYCFGQSMGLSPEAPTPKVLVQKETFCLGGAANVARNLKSLGSETMLIGAIGNDSGGKKIRSLLDEEKITHRLISCESVKTTTKQRIFHNGSQVVRADFESILPAEISSKISDHCAEWLSWADLIVFSDYRKGALSDISRQIQIAIDFGKKIIIDPKGEDFRPYRGASILTPNKAEFDNIMGPSHNEKSLTNKAQTMLKDLALEHLIITKDEDGLTLVSNDGQVLNIPAIPIKALNVSGAGDTFIAALAISICSGKPIDKACKTANVAAGLAVKEMGTTAVTQRELSANLSKTSKLDVAEDHWISCSRNSAIPGLKSGAAFSGNSKLTNSRDLNTILKELRSCGKKIVFTNGCFDLLHAGHVSYLNKARELGHQLVVAVNDDNSLRRLKGNYRPINPLHMRCQMLAALDCVDWVVSFSEDTPEALLSLIKPDILVKGGDYNLEEVVGRDLVMAYGGQVCIIEKEYDCSTSDIVQKILSQELDSKDGANQSELREGHLIHGE